MKKLTIEEKACRYDKAIERANSLLSDNQLGNAWIYKLFPELRESEEEEDRIRNYILSHLQQHLKTVREFTSKGLTSPFSAEEIKMLEASVAWLEKHTDTDNESTRMRETKPKDISEFLDRLTTVEQEFLWEHIAKIRELDKEEQKDILEDTILDSNEDGLIAETIRYKNEQKLVDKVEPKFHKGEWIVFNGLTLCVKEVVKGFYITTSKDGITNGYDWSIDNAARLWTIQDAKDGDVLVHNGCTFIFVGIKDGIVQAIEENILEPVSFGEPDKDNDYHPATKKQRNLLFQKMKGAGYVWDTEDKQLKKIEQKHTPKHKVGDTIHYNSFGELKSMIVANVTTGGTDNPMYEDENGNAVFEKDLVEQKTPWSKEDERTIKRIDSLLHAINESEFEDIHNWLKSLKDRVLPQPKQEWSEEDENYLNALIRKMETLYFKNDSFSIGGYRVDVVINWLKSIRPQSHWKPSEQQLKTLQVAIDIIGEVTLTGTDLKELLEQLKKLREE